ncbi:MAG: single-stranded DNA-binding protein [Plesiomonas shigelloides]
MSINVFTASGHIGSDMEVRYTGGGTCIGSFSLPVESGYGERKKVVWVTCRIIGERAEKLAPYIKKGGLITVTGTFSMDEWETDGVKYSRPCILVSNMQLPPRQAQQDQPAPQGEPPQFDDDPIPF